MSNSYQELSYRDVITYWAPSTIDLFGDRGFATPICFKGRWEIKSELFITTTGEESRSNAVVWVPQTVLMGGYLSLGELTDADPQVLDDTHEIRGIKEIPTVTGGFFERRVFL